MSPTVGPEFGLVDRPSTVAELRMWPLLHGSLHLRRLSEAIRASGLHASGSTGRRENSFNYDTILGRTDYVFLAPPGIRGYGAGNVVVVDPGVLQIEGARGTLYDVGNVVRQIERLIKDPNCLMPTWVCDRAQLADLVGRNRSWSEQDADVERAPANIRSLVIEDRTKKRVVSSPEFRDYVGRYEMEPEAFLTALVEQNRGLTMREFLQREDTVMQPEFLVPRYVSPSYLLGCVIDGIWYPWTAPASRDTAERVSELVRLRTA